MEEKGHSEVEFDSDDEVLMHMGDAVVGRGALIRVGTSSTLGSLQDAAKVFQQSTKTLKIEELRPSQYISGAFIANFDIKAGAVLEFTRNLTTDTIDWERVGEKALPSGSHLQKQDFLLFKTGDQFGIACFHRLRTLNSSERNARMRSAGIIGNTYECLLEHIPMLTYMARDLNRTDAAGRSALAETFTATVEDLKLSSGSVRLDKTIRSLVSSDSLPMIENMLVSRFIQYFELKTLLLWKAALLQKRILFYCRAGSPTHIVTSRLLAYTRICHSSIEAYRSVIRCNPLFYVTLADYDTLKTMPNYIAFTTEAIFRDHPSVYDVFVDEPDIHIPDPALARLLRRTKGDSKRYKSLNSLLDRGTSTSCDVDDKLGDYFSALNSCLIEKLLDAVCDGKDVYKEDMERFGLTQSDFHFLRGLVAELELQITVGSVSPEAFSFQSIKYGMQPNTCRQQ